MAPDGEGFAKLGVRVGSALVLGAIVLAVVLFGGPAGLGALLALAAGLGGFELCRLVPSVGRRASTVAGVSAGGVVLAAGAGASSLGGIGGMVAALAVFSVVLVGALAWLTLSKTSSAEGIGGIALAVLWVGFGLAHLVFLRGLDPGGQPLALLTVLCVWAGDVAAYLVGVSIGRHKLAPSLSPGKSWEGFGAGLAATVAVWVLLGPPLQVPLGLPLLGAIGVAAAVAGLLGDLAESRMKRLAGVKDSGSLIPGHGGVLDRVDSLILVSVVVFWTVTVGGIA